MDRTAAGAEAVQTPKASAKALHVTLTEFERNAATIALSDTYRINPRTEQSNSADRAYYKLIDAKPFGGPA